MLLTAIKHYLYDIALNAMFDKILFNFPMKRKYEECNHGALKVGDYILVIDPYRSDEWSKGYVSNINKYKYNIGVSIGIKVIEGKEMLAFNPKFYTMYKIN